MTLFLPHKLFSAKKAWTLAVHAFLAEFLTDYSYPWKEYFVDFSSPSYRRTWTSWKKLWWDLSVYILCDWNSFFHIKSENKNAGCLDVWKEQGWSHGSLFQIYCSLTGRLPWPRRSAEGVCSYQSLILAQDVTSKEGPTNLVSFSTVSDIQHLHQVRWELHCTPKIFYCFIVLWEAACWGLDVADSWSVAIQKLLPSYPNFVTLSFYL